MFTPFNHKFIIKGGRQKPIILVLSPKFIDKWKKINLLIGNKFSTCNRDEIKTFLDISSNFKCALNNTVLHYTLLPTKKRSY